MIKKIISTFGIKIAIAVINLAIVILLSQYTGASGKGEASLIVTSIAFIGLVCSFVGGPTLVYLVPRNNIFQLLFLSYLWSILICTISFFVLQVFNLIPAEFNTHVAALSLLSAVITTNLTSLLGKEKIISRNLLALFQSVLNISILVLFFYFFKEKSVNAYIASLYVAFSTIGILSFILLLPYLKKINFSGFRSAVTDAYKFGFYNQAGNIMQFLSLRISYYFLLKYAGESGVGVYSNGVSLAESIWLVSNSMAMVQYSRIANNENRKENQELTLKLIKASTVFCIAGVIPLLVLPVEFYEWLFGDEFTGVKTVILILAPGIVIYNLELIISHYFSGTGRYHINTLGNLTGLIVTILLTLLLIPDYGITEAAIIAVLSYTTTALFITWQFVREPGLQVKKLLLNSADLNFIKNEVKSLMNKLKI